MEPEIEDVLRLDGPGLVVGRGAARCPGRRRRAAAAGGGLRRRRGCLGLPARARAGGEERRGEDERPAERHPSASMITVIPWPPPMQAEPSP